MRLLEFCKKETRVNKTTTEADEEAGYTISSPDGEWHVTARTLRKGRVWERLTDHGYLVSCFCCFHDLKAHYATFFTGL